MQRTYKTRYRRVMRFFTRLMIGELWWDIVLPKVGLRRLSERGRSGRMRRAASSFRLLAVRMGGVLIKVGQFLSARLDVMPREITAELAGLQDEVGAESFEDIRQVIEAEFGAPLEQRFLELEPVPIASASIGQAHCARLCAQANGEPCPPVVVKVQRPHIEQIVEADLAVLRVVGRWVNRLASVRKHANVPALIEEFSRTLYEEIDYLHEGKNAEQFAKNFQDRPEVRVPEVIWSHTTRRVLTLQDVGAIKITDYAAIEAAGVSRAEVARRLVDSYLKQIFEDGFFHADPHPGNLFVLPTPAAEEAAPAGDSASVPFRLVFVDFGMTGTVARDSFGALREALIAVGTQDAARLVGSFQKLNMLLPGTDLALMERMSNRIFERIWGKSTREMMQMSSEDMQAFSDEFGELLYEMPFQLPENLVLLGRCVSILSGMATGLDPDFRVWDVIAPYAQKLVEEAAGGGARVILGEIAAVARLLLALPKRVDSLIGRIEQGKLEVRLPEIRQYVSRFERAVLKLAGAIVFGTVLVTGAVLYLNGHVQLGVGLGAAAGALLLWVIFGR
jgi:predicted unusual protein kinase regulating ubiquinone biosynthesis (AarF/ABC1/UbiB family)